MPAIGMGARKMVKDSDAATGNFPGFLVENPDDPHVPSHLWGATVTNFVMASNSSNMHKRMTPGDKVEAALTSYRMRGIGAWQAHLAETAEGAKKGSYFWASQTNSNMDDMDGSTVIHCTGVPNGSHFIGDRLWEIIYEGYIGQCRDQSASSQLDARTTHQVSRQK